MNRINYNQTGGFPLDTNNLNFLQESLKIMQAFGNIAGNFAIISGCQQNGSTVSNGVLFINGEVIEFRGGNVGDNVIINEESVKGTFEDGFSKVIEVTRYATFGTSTQNYPWRNFKRIFPTTEIQSMKEGIEGQIAANGQGIRTNSNNIGALNNRADSLQNQINGNAQNIEGLKGRIGSLENQLAALTQRTVALENRKSPIPIGLIAIWNRPANEIPAGWRECTDLRGRVPVGLDLEDSDFAFGVKGGEKTHQLSINEMPKHFHQQGSEAIYNDYGGGTLVGYRTYVREGQSSYRNQNTSIVGGSMAHNNLQPYRVVNFIEYIG